MITIIRWWLQKHHFIHTWEKWQAPIQVTIGNGPSLVQYRECKVCGRRHYRQIEAPLEK